MNLLDALFVNLELTRVQNNITLQAFTIQHLNRSVFKQKGA